MNLVVFFIMNFSEMYWLLVMVTLTLAMVIKLCYLLAKNFRLHSFLLRMT